MSRRIQKLREARVLFFLIFVSSADKAFPGGFGNVFGAELHQKR